MDYAPHPPPPFPHEPYVVLAYRYRSTESTDVASHAMTCVSPCSHDAPSPGDVTSRPHEVGPGVGCGEVDGAGDGAGEVVGTDVTVGSGVGHPSTQPEQV